MSFKLVQTHAAGGDACAPYKVELDSPYTVGEFIKEAMNKRSNEWGKLALRRSGSDYFDTFFSIDYRYGVLAAPIPQEIANLRIESATSYGGWSAMDYNIIVN